MDFILMLKAAFLGIVEGLTEFLPISSTGHLILAQAGFDGLFPASATQPSHEFWSGFEVAIQFGAIIAVMWEFRSRIGLVLTGMAKREPVSWRFAINVIIATIPAVALALIFGDKIKEHLFNPVAVAIALIVGGFIIIAAERRQAAIAPTVTDMDDLSYLDALKVGLAQTLAVVFPGTSRSGATIIGGMFFGLSRQTATNFSFFLAIPILFGAFVKGLYGMRELLNAQAWVLFVIGFVFSLISAFICVRWLLKFVSNNNFIGFAWYRIIFGVLILVLAHWLG